MKPFPVEISSLFDCRNTRDTHCIYLLENIRNEDKHRTLSMRISNQYIFIGNQTLKPNVRLRQPDLLLVIRTGTGTAITAVLLQVNKN